MKIAFIHPNWPGSEGTGATHSATQVVEGLSERDHDLCVYCPERPPEGGCASVDYDLKILEDDWLPHTGTRLNRSLYNRIDEFDQYDIVHSYLPSLVPGLEKIGKRTSATTIVTLNAYGGVCPKNDLLYLDEKNCSDNRTAKCIECILRTSGGHDEFSAPYRIASRMGNLRLVRNGIKQIEYIDGFRAPSAHVKKNYTELGYPAEKISVIPHPLDDEFLVEHEGDFSEPFRLLYVGYLEKHKGVDKLVPIVSGLQQELDQRVELTVVGDGGLRSNLEDQVQEYDVADAVDFRGFIPNSQLPSIYANHDLFVYPGIWEEPLGRVYLEALAAGTPIVSSDYGSIAEIMGGGGVTTDGSIAGFCETILEIVENDQCERLSEVGKRKAEEYRLESVISQIEEMYNLRASAT